MYIYIKYLLPHTTCEHVASHRKMSPLFCNKTLSYEVLGKMESSSRKSYHAGFKIYYPTCTGQTAQNGQFGLCMMGSKL